MTLSGSPTLASQRLTAEERQHQGELCAHTWLPGIQAQCDMTCDVRRLLARLAIPVVALSGLPELARYWLTAEKRQPKGELFAHTRPPGMQGLHTDPGNNTGFDNTHLYVRRASLRAGPHMS